MNSTLINNENTGNRCVADLKLSNVKVATKEETVLKPLLNSQNSPINEEKLASHIHHSNKKYIDDTDDSFEIFVPLSIKKNTKHFKSAASPNKAKKKKVTTSNRICPYFTARKTPNSVKEDKDLQLALARSLADFSPAEASDNILKPVTNDRKASKLNAEFLKNLTSKSKKPGLNTLLFRRTHEERQNILTKKVAIILVGKENIEHKNFQDREIQLISSVLEGYWDKNSTLWERSKTNKNNLADFYVATLEKFIEPPPPSINMPDADVMQENDNSKRCSTIMNNKSDNKYCDLTEDNNPNCEENYNETLKNFGFNKSHSIDKDELITNSLNLLSDDFCNLFASGELSDIEVMLNTGETIPCHRLILHSRCPSLLQKQEHPLLSDTLDFSQYSAKATLAFLKYFYSGKIEFIYELSSEDRNDLLVLAKKYNVMSIEKFILSAFNCESFRIYSESTCSPPNSPISSPDSTNPFSNESPKQTVEHSDFHSLFQNSNTEKSFLSTLTKQNQTVNISEIESTNVQPPYSFSSKKEHSEKKSISFLTNDSAYDLFRDDIKTTCNSSILNHNHLSLTKRKLDYSNISYESKKLCSKSAAKTIGNSPEVVDLDSESTQEYLDSPRAVSDTSTLPNDDKPPLNEILSDNSANNFDLNIRKSYCDVSVKNEFSSGVVQVIPSPKQILSPFESSQNYHQSSSRKFSFNNNKSFDKYFEASFPDIIENIDNIEAPSNPNTSSTPVNPASNSLYKKALTPIQEIIIKDATPKPDYSSMISPALKAELRKYGIKPDLDQRKARALLRYIYDQIHPVTSELPGYKSPVASASKESTSPIVIDDDSDHSEPKEIRMESENDFAYEEYLFNCSKNWNENPPNLFENKISNLKTTMVKFLKSDEELFFNVVLFRPLLLKKFYKTVKEHGIQCSLHELMDVLDDLCVNYHVEKTGTRQTRQRRKKAVKRKYQRN